MQASRDLVGHGADVYLAGCLLYNSSIKHASCMKVSFWVSSRRARVGVSEARPTLRTHPKTYLHTDSESHHCCLTGKRQVNNGVRVEFSFGFFFTGMG